MKETQRLDAGAYGKNPYVLEKIGIAVRNELDEAPKNPLKDFTISL